MPDLFDCEGRDDKLPENERIELQRRISIFYPVVSHLLRALLGYPNSDVKIVRGFEMCDEQILLADGPGSILG